MLTFLRQSEFCKGIIRAGREIPSDLRKVRGSVSRGRLIRRYLAEHSIRMLQIGAGPNELRGWLNADFNPRNPTTIYLDATKPFPLPDQSFDFIFSEHMIEHVPFEAGMQMLRECQRILKHGGRIRIATPNLENIAALETSQPSEQQRRYVRWAIENHVPASLAHKEINEAYRPAYVVNNFFWGFGHYFVYDPRTLSAALMAAGFSDVTSYEPGESDQSELRGLEQHAHLIGDEFNAFETMVLQASKR